MASFADLPGIALGIAPLQEARASAALPAVGAWDASPTELFISEAEYLTIVFTYTPGAQSDGAFQWRLEHSIYSDAALVPAGAEEWHESTAYEVNDVVLGDETESVMQEDIGTYQETGAAAEGVTYGPIKLGGTVERIRIPCRETGDTGNPGTLQVQIICR